MNYSTHLRKNNRVGFWQVEMAYYMRFLYFEQRFLSVIFRNFLKNVVSSVLVFWQPYYEKFDF
jgi:arginyl-tRNA--protein-N-Asp/Glu arginylyltransferase